MAERKLKPGWRTWRFEQMAQIVNDRIDNPAEAGSEYYVGLEHLDSDSLKIRRWGKPTDVEATKLRFRKGDIIFGRRRAYQRKLAVAEFDGICSAHAMVLRARPEVASPEFLPFFMQSDVFMKRALQISVGSLSPTINWRTLAAQEFALPPRREQERIAELLFSVQFTRETFIQAEQKAARLSRSLLEFSFSHKNLDSVPLSTLCEKGGIQIGPFGAQLHQSDYADEGVPVVMPKDMVNDTVCLDSIARITNKKAEELSHHRVRAGDILLPRRGELNRRAWVSSKAAGFLCGTGSIRIRPQSSVDSRAIFYSLSSPATVRWLEANSVGTTMMNLNSTIVSAIPVRLPPEGELQNVVRILDRLQSEIAALSQRQKHLLEIGLPVLGSNV